MEGFTMRNASRFQRGSGCYICQGCGKRTRSTGRGDNEHVRMCEDCYDEAGLENMHSDEGHAGEFDVCEICHPKAEGGAR
jgi:hypothetical protein